MAYLDDLIDDIEARIDQEYLTNPELSFVDKSTVLEIIVENLNERRKCLCSQNDDRLVKLVDYFIYAFNPNFDPREIFRINYTEFEIILKRAIKYINECSNPLSYQVYKSIHIIVDKRIDGFVVYRDLAVDRYDSLDDIVSIYMTSTIVRKMIDYIEKWISFFRTQANLITNNEKEKDRLLAQVNDFVEMRIFMKNYKVNH